MTAPRLIARQQEFNRLCVAMERAVAGQGALWFIVGDAGSGKSTLAEAVAHHALETHKQLVAVSGGCDPQTGAEDSFLPFREIVAALIQQEESAPAPEQQETGSALHRARGVAKSATTVLSEHGPDLIDLFLPGVGLALDIGRTVAAKSGLAERLRPSDSSPFDQASRRSVQEVEQAQIFEQYINVLHSLAEHAPLLLILDDLHWADSATVDLLFRLGRRVPDSRILLLCTYRAAEVQLGRGGERHPLAPVLSEFKRYFGDVFIDLNESMVEQGHAFVRDLLSEMELHGDDSFQQQLYRHTAGHPLFTVEIVRALQERGALRPGTQGWTVDKQLDWSQLPARVEGIIEERINRLSAELRETLTIASIQGEHFTSEIVARVQAVETRTLIRQLSGELQKAHRLVVAEGTERRGTQRLSQYRFTHQLIQGYLYGQLDEVERSYLHEEVGTFLEALYGTEAHQIAVQLAYHFEQAELPEKVRHYLALAGHQAAARHGTEQAVTFWTRALALTPPEAVEERWMLLLAREGINHLRGERDEQQRDLAALARLVRQSDDPARVAEVALRRSRLLHAIAEYEASIAVAAEGFRWAQQAGDSTQQALSRQREADALRALGRYDEARARYEQALALAHQARDVPGEARCGQGLGVIAAQQARFDGARTHLTAARALYETLGDGRGAARCLQSLAIVAKQQGEYEEARALGAQALARYRQVGDRQGEGRCLNNLANLRRDQGYFAEASRDYQAALALYREIGDRRGEGHCLINSGLTAARVGRFVSAARALVQALRIAREIGDRWAESICLETLGRVARDSQHHAQAQQYLEESLAICRAIEFRVGEGIVLSRLGILAADQGAFAEAIRYHEQALALRRTLAHPDGIAEELAGLAHAHQQMGQEDKSAPFLTELLAYLAANPPLSGAEHPARVWWLAYEVLRAQGDPRAGALLEGGHRWLQEQAQKILDPEMRDTFLSAIPANQALVRAHAAAHTTL